MRRKVPTWDVLQKRFLSESGWCFLCKSTEETIEHIFLSCTFTKKVWDYTLTLCDIKDVSRGDNCSEAWKDWWKNCKYHDYKCLPLIISWGI